jgi:hypothetical protein
LLYIGARLVRIKQVQNFWLFPLRFSPPFVDNSIWETAMAKFIGRPTIEGIVTLYRALMGRDMPFKQIERLKQRAKRDADVAPRHFTKAGEAASASDPILEGASDPDKI